MPRPFAVIGFTVFFTIALLFNFDTGVTVAALTVFSVALVIALLIKPVRNSRVIPCSLASAVLSCILFLTSVEFLYLPAVSYENKICDIHAALVSEPEYEYGNCYYTARVKTIDGDPVDLKIRLTLSPSTDIEPYDEIKGKFNFYIPGKSNDISLSSNVANGIFVAAYPHDEDYEIINIPESEKPFMKKIIDIRADIKNAVYRILPNETGALAVALLIGDKSGLSSETLENFRFIGISHIICVSGYHLSLWSMLAYELLRKTGLSLRISSLLCIFPVVFFMLISGMTYSVIRAGIMMLIYLLSNVVLRKRDSLNSLGFSLMLIAVFNPFALGSVSLQLSALATAGILIFSEYYSVKIENFVSRIGNSAFRGAVKSVISTLMLTLASNAFTLPVSLSLYNTFNFTVFIANIIAVPVSGLCMVLCAAGALIGCFTTSFVNVPAYFGGITARFLLWFSDKLSDFRILSFRTEPDETSVIIISLFLVVVFSLLLSYFGKSYPKLTFILCSVIFTTSVITFSLTEKSLTKIQVVDCGNGTSVIISKGDETALIGCGGTEFQGAFNLCYAIQDTGNKLGTVIFPDSDNNSSVYLSNVLGSFDVDRIYCDDFPSYCSPLIMNKEKYSFSDKIEICGFDIECQTVENKSFASVRNDDASILILFDPVNNLDQIPEKYRDADVLISRNDYPSEIENTCFDLVLINSDNQRGIILQNELRNKGVNCAVTAGCGDILIKADDGYISAVRN